MKLLPLALLSGIGFGLSGTAVNAETSTGASSIEAFSKRLESLEAENRSLRQRIGVLEGTRHVSPAKSKASLSAAGSSPEQPIRAASPRDAFASAAPAYNWTGFYAGAHAGAGLSQNDWSNLDLICFQGTCLNPSAPAVGASGLGAGLLGGFQAGYNWQVQRWVIGIDGQYSFADLKTDTQSNRQDQILVPSGALNSVITSTGMETLSARIVGLGTLGARVGYAPEWLDGLLLFGKAGGAYARTNVNENYRLQYINCFRNSCSNGFIYTGTANGALDSWGWFAGVGGEYALTRDVSASVEYDFLDFGTSSVAHAGSQCQAISGFCVDWTRTADLNQKVHLVKFGLNYHLH